MSASPQRIIEVRLIVIVQVDTAAHGLARALAASGANLNVAQVMAGQIQATLESLPYVDSLTVNVL
jgi:hypothetical protein